MSAQDLCASLRADLSSLFDCQPRSRGDVRVRTPFVLPDRDLVDIYVIEEDQRFVVTDFGLAMSWLRMHTATGKLTPSTRLLIDDLLQTLTVTLSRGQLEIRDIDQAGLPLAVHCLGQAVVRVADLLHTIRPRKTQSVADEVDDWLRQREFQVRRRTTHRGLNAHWTVDFEVRAGQRTSLAFVLSSGSKAGAREIRHRVYTGFSDIRSNPEGPSEDTLISVIDDTSDVWSNEDLGLLSQVSRLALWSSPDDIERALTTPINISEPLEELPSLFNR